MFWYYQLGEREPWQTVKDRRAIEAHVRELGAKKLTILALNEPVDDDDQSQADRLTYKGPLYFDVDMKDDIVGAAHSTQRLVERLTTEYEVQDSSIGIYASGGKGFHVIIPAKVFGNGKALKALPRVYAKVAAELYVPGLDMGVYSMGRGVTWRLANIQREDGRYRVQITRQELESVKSVDDYLSLTSKPRPLTELEPVSAPALEVLFERCKIDAGKKEKVVAPVEDARLKEHFSSDLPECVEQVVSGKYSASKNYNEASMQVAVFLARAGIADGQAESLIARMADNGHSSKYSTDRSRREHTLGLWRYASTKAAMKFSCAGMRSVCASRPCSGCPIETVNGHESAEDMALSVGLLIKDGGYVKLGKERDIRLSNFTLDPQNVFMQTDYTGQKVRTSTQMEVSVEGIPAGVVRFSEEGWKGKAAMLDQISGLGNAFFVGSDTDVQLLKYLTYHEGRDMGEVIEVFSAGIHIHKVAGKSRRVYVEPSGSITEHQVRDTHQLSGEIPAAPRVLDSVMTPPGDLATQEVLKNLLQVNAPDVVSQVLGWFCAAHLRRHFMELEGQFPVLSLWGSAESGKTRTASLFGHLNGCDYAMQDAPVSLPTIKEFGLVMQCASSTTVPRILDEYNRGRMNANRFNMVTDILISSWNALSVSRGTISAASRRINGSGRTGATSVNIPLTAPLCVLSEQRPSVTALVHRSLQVGLSTQTREGRDHQFNYAFRGRELLIGFSKAMVLQSLRTPDSWVREKMDLVDCLVPKGVQDRARYTYKVAMVGLILFEEVCLGLNLDLSEEIASLRQGREVHLESNEVAIVAEKGRSEIDVVMESLALMAHSTAVSQQMGGHEAWLYAGHHYVVDQGFLYFQPMSVFSAYQRYAKLHGLDVHMPSSRAFSELLRQERYVVRTDATHQLMPGQSGLVEIDMDKVKEKGLHEFADLFRSAYDVAS